MKLMRFGALSTLVLLLVLSAAPAGDESRFSESLFGPLTWRNLGPFRTGAWLTAIAVPDAPLTAHLYTFYVGFRNGGVWKTTNNGTTFEPVFDGQTSLSIGAIDVAPSDARVVWVGTGEAYSARSSYSGDGVYKSTDAGKTWTHMGLRDSHHISRLLIHPKNPDIVYVAAMEDPYNVYGGLQDHESWKGPSNSWSGAVNIADWITVGEGDGMYNRVDPTDSRWLFNAREFGSHRRIDQAARTITDIMPRRPKGEPPLRFSWITPIALSPHNPSIVYTGAQVLSRSLNRGGSWQEISPDLTTGNAAKTYGRGNIQHCTMTTISESPVTAGVIWIGTDDGKVRVTRTHGAAWVDATAAIANVGGPADRWVGRVFASSHDAGTAYVAKTGFRNDDFRPYLFKTLDYGATWTSISAGLPDQPINVVWEDRTNPRLLFVGNDKGVWVTIDGGARWVRMKGDMPNVPVHDLLVHAREQDLIVGTCGRAIYITDASVLQQLTENVLAEDVHLFDIKPRKPFQASGWGNYDQFGDRHTPHTQRTECRQHPLLPSRHHGPEGQPQGGRSHGTGDSVSGRHSAAGPELRGVGCARWQTARGTERRLPGNRRDWRTDVREDGEDTVGGRRA